MQRLIQHKETLIYYDGPQLFLAHDQFNTPYLCLLVEQDDDADKFICVPISLARLEMFYQGGIALRTVYEAPESGELFYVQIGNEDGETFQLVPLAEVPAEWLPEPDFFFEEEISHDGEQIELIGRITQADLYEGTWALHSIPDNQPYRGFLSDAQHLSLSGLILGEQLYKFICQQRVEARQERAKLYLVEYQSLPQAA
jgi:hypothetical protein